MGIQINGQTDTISATDGSFTISGASGNLTGTASTATAAATAYGLSGSPTLSGITSISTTNLTVNGNAYPATGPLSNRNLIINGAMQVWQRGTTFASDAVGGGRYTADRWNVPNRTRAARSTDAPSGFTYSLLIDREQTGGVEPFTVSTGIEVQDITQTGSHTLSFYAKSADITTLNINVQDRTLVREGGTNNLSIVTDEAITIDNTWTRYTHTFTISSVSFTGTSMRISIGNTSAAQDDEALITGVQLEVGSVATPFEHRSYGDELIRCQRYFETNYDQTISIGSGTSQNNLLAVCPGNINRAYGHLQFQVRKRAAATVVFYSTSGASGKFRNASQGADITMSAACSFGDSGISYEASSGIVAVTDRMQGLYTAEAEL